MEKLKKALLIGLTPPEEGGSQMHIYEIAENTKNVEVLTQKGSLCTNKIELPVLEYTNFLRNISFFFVCFIYSLKLLFVKKHELIHIHENLLYFLVPILRLRYKVIVTVHGINGFKFYDKKYLWFFFRNALKAANKIILVSSEDKKVLDKVFKDITYIPNGVDTAVYDKMKVKVGKNITFIGRIHEQKGIFYLLEAYDRIKDKMDYKLNIIGKINDYALELQKRFDSKNIIWKGFISEKKVIAKELKSSYCIVLPSLWEGLPLTLFEALATGRPVIVSSLPTIKSIVKTEVLFVKPRNVDDIEKQILKIVNNKKLANTLGLSGKQVAKKFDWKNIAGQTDKVYDQVLAK